MSDKVHYFNSYPEFIYLSLLNFIMFIAYAPSDLIFNACFLNDKLFYFFIDFTYFLNFYVIFINLSLYSPPIFILSFIENSFISSIFLLYFYLSFILSQSNGLSANLSKYFVYFIF